MLCLFAGPFVPVSLFLLCGLCLVAEKIRQNMLLQGVKNSLRRSPRQGKKIEKTACMVPVCLVGELGQDNMYGSDPTDSPCLILESRDDRI